MNSKTQSGAVMSSGQEKNNAYSEIRDYFQDSDDGWVNWVNEIAGALNDDSNLNAITQTLACLDEYTGGEDPVALIEQGNETTRLYALLAAVAIEILRGTRDNRNQIMNLEREDDEPMNIGTYNEWEGDKMENQPSNLMRIGFDLAEASALMNAEAK